MKQKLNKKNIHKRTFTIGEINHILNLLYRNEQEGIYNGNKEQYWERHLSIVEKLSN